ncbi:hypothetical protein B0H34DRAFT_794110 [Crassisporium funariophilum]|nr:hypothetical protein B0H34DRAFT_794110 [Crassisporium funariophilum]
MAPRQLKKEEKQQKKEKVSTSKKGSKKVSASKRKLVKSLLALNSSGFVIIGEKWGDPQAVVSEEGVLERMLPSEEGMLPSEEGMLPSEKLRSKKLRPIKKAQRVDYTRPESPPSYAEPSDRFGVHHLPAIETETEPSMGTSSQQEELSSSVSYGQSVSPTSTREMSLPSTNNGRRYTGALAGDEHQFTEMDRTYRYQSTPQTNHILPFGYQCGCGLHPSSLPAESTHSGISFQPTFSSNFAHDPLHENGAQCWNFEHDSRVYDDGYGQPFYPSSLAPRSTARLGYREGASDLHYSSGPAYSSPSHSYPTTNGASSTMLPNIPTYRVINKTLGAGEHAR